MGRKEKKEILKSAETLSKPFNEGLRMSPTKKKLRRLRGGGGEGERGHE